MDGAPNSRHICSEASIQRWSPFSGFHHHVGGPAVKVPSHCFLTELQLYMDTVFKNNFNHYFFAKKFIKYSHYFYETIFQDESTYIAFIFSNLTQRNLFIVKV